MATVLLVMKRPGNIRVMAEVLGAIGYVVVGTPDHDALAATLAQPDDSRIALVDVSDFRPADWRLCQLLQSHHVRFLVLGPARSARSGGEAIRRGATGFLQKPIQKSSLLQIVASLVGEPMSIHS